MVDIMQMSRAILIAVAVALSATPNALAQEKKPARIGLLHPGAPDGQSLRYIQALHDKLSTLGHARSRDYVFEPRWARGNLRRYANLASDLVRIKADVIVVHGKPAAEAAKRATSRIPIVLAVVGNPVAIGLVPSLAKPGGNITGVTTSGLILIAKRFQVLKEMVPSISRVAVLADPAGPAYALKLPETQKAIRVLGIVSKLYLTTSAHGDAKAFDSMVKDRTDALLVMPSGSLFSRRTEIAQLALRHGLPSVYGQKGDVEAGGLVSYGNSFARRYAQAAIYVDKILRGAQPADLPIQQPSEYDMTINLRTAKALGITIPQSILLRATEVIE